MAEGRAADSGIRRALDLLVGEVRDLLRRHPQGHLLAGRRGHLDLKLVLPTSRDDASLAKASDDTRQALVQGIHGLLTHCLTLHLGRVYCLRCTSSGCEHAVPDTSRQVFAGYGSTGMPRFLDLGQHLLELHDPQVGLLYDEPPRLVTVVFSEQELTRELLPAFRDADTGYRLHGQVSAGWYRAPGSPGGGELVAVSFQVVSSQARGQPRRFGLNVVGLLPGGAPLENLYDSLGEVPWAAAARWAQEVLAQVEDHLRRPGSRRRNSPAGQLEKRLQGLLEGLARRLRKGRRSSERRTRHAETRRRQDQRPTDKALADLAHARQDQILFDGRRETLIVLGEKGRAHVFNQAGKLVTSIRYSPASIARRRKNGLWRDAEPDEIAELRHRVATHGVAETSTDAGP